MGSDISFKTVVGAFLFIGLIVYVFGYVYPAASLRDGAATATQSR